MRRMKKASKKAMKKSAKKTMKARRMKKKVSNIAKGKLRKSQVFKGRKVKTSGGLKKGDLTKNKRGKVVSKRQSAAAKSRYTRGIGKWIAAVTKARKALRVTGFAAVGGKSSQGQALLRKARSLYK